MTPMSPSHRSRTIEILSEARYVQAESPRWDGRDGGVAWIDMATGGFHRGRLEDGRVVPGPVVTVGARIGAPVPLAGAGDGWAVAVDRGLVHVSDDGVVSPIATDIAGPGDYMNDGGADPHGRFWVGSQAVPRDPHCALWSIDSGGVPTERLSGVTVSNGLAFDRTGSRLYYIDTLPHRSIEAFDVSPDGRLSNRRTVCRVDGGNPDGLTIDDEDALGRGLGRLPGAALFSGRHPHRDDRAAGDEADGGGSHRQPAAHHDREYRPVAADSRRWRSARGGGRGRRCTRTAVAWRRRTAQGGRRRHDRRGTR